MTAMRRATPTPSVQGRDLIPEQTPTVTRMFTGIFAAPSGIFSESSATRLRHSISLHGRPVASRATGPRDVPRLASFAGPLRRAIAEGGSVNVCQIIGNGDDLPTRLGFVRAITLEISGASPKPHDPPGGIKRAGVEREDVGAAGVGEMHPALIRRKRLAHVIPPSIRSVGPARPNSPECSAIQISLGDSKLDFSPRPGPD
jgi:hypothetical protein